MDGGSSAVKLKGEQRRGGGGGRHKVRGSELPRGVWQPGCVSVSLYVHAHVPIPVPCVSQCVHVCGSLCMDLEGTWGRRWSGPGRQRSCCGGMVTAYMGFLT